MSLWCTNSWIEITSTKNLKKNDSYDAKLIFLNFLYWAEIKYGNSRCCDFILSICYKCLWDWRDFDISRKINITTLYYSILLRFHPYVYIHCRSSVISCLLLSSQTSQKFAIFVFITHSILNIKEQYEVILINGIVYDIICEF